MEFIFIWLHLCICLCQGCQKGYQYISSKETELLLIRAQISLCERRKLMEACEWTFASWILASHRSAHNRTFNQHQASQRLLTAPNISLELMLGIHTSPTPFPLAHQKTLCGQCNSPHGLL